MKKNKIICLLLSVFLMIGIFTSCNSNKNKTDNTDKKIKVISTIFPTYDVAKEIVGEKANNFDIELLSKNGVDLHSYKPSADDIVRIAKSNIFIYVGGESDKWAEDVIKQAKKINPNLICVNLVKILGDKAKEEEVKEGMEKDDHDDHDDHDKEDEKELDEHVWLSLENMETFTEEIGKVIGKVDSKNAEYYKKQADIYEDKLDKLDDKYEDTVKKSSKKTLIFADRFPFRYLIDDYKLNYYAAFVGCSTESNASFETVKFLANKADQNNLNYILVIEGNNKKIANSVIQNTKNKNQKILTMDSMQSINENDIKSGKTYLKTMENNLEILKKALS